MPVFPTVGRMAILLALFPMAGRRAILGALGFPAAEPAADGSRGDGPTSSLIAAGSALGLPVHSTYFCVWYSMLDAARQEP